MCDEENIKHIVSEINIPDESTTMTMSSDCSINDDSDGVSFKEFLMFSAIDGSVNDGLDQPFREQRLLWSIPHFS